VIRVLIADDHPVVRRGLKQTMDETPDIRVVGEAENGAEAVNKLSDGTFDVVLLDISMPGRGGIDALKRIKSTNPATPVLVLSVHPEDQYALRALKTGASGYLMKNCEPEELIGAIRKVAVGGKHITQTVAEKLALEISSDTGKLPHETLSNREYEVLRKISSGKTVSQIAEELALSVKTISTHRARILRKMNMKTNAELTRYCFKHRLVE
jgi:DNA-binding NarL/FixJ family response regulator